MLVIALSLCRWFHRKTGNVYPAEDSMYSTPININKYFRNVLGNYLNCTRFHFLMTYTTLPCILVTSRTVQCLEKFKTPHR